MEADLLAAAHELDVPVRIVHGARDPRPVWAVQSLAEAPRADLVVLEGVGHLPWLENPDAFRRTTRDFMLPQASAGSRTVTTSAAKRH